MLKIQEDSLNWSLKHVLNFGDTDVFPLPFEYEAIESDWDNAKAYLLDQNVLDWVIRPHRILISPKSKYGFRTITQLDPYDFLIFTSLVKEIAEDIERRRVSLVEDIVFSYRYQHNQDGRFFSKDVKYATFLAKCKEHIKKENTTYIAVTDISDFYSRIYHHRLENALSRATKKNNHAKAIMKLLSGWNERESFGIPIGNAASRLLAEIAISDVDEALMYRKVRFIRYNDDYRIFTNSYSEAYRHLAFLADFLYKNHGLTLNPQKTSIETEDSFREKFLLSFEERETSSLIEKFDEISLVLGLSDPYELINVDDLDEAQMEMIESLNLLDMFYEEIEKEEHIDLTMIRSLLRRLGQINENDIIKKVFEYIDDLHPIFPEVIRYFLNLRDLSFEQKKYISSRILSLLYDSIISELDYHRMWALSLFTHRGWDLNGNFYSIFCQAQDPHSKRKLILAMGIAKYTFFFQSNWRELFAQPPWIRRSIIAGSRCLPSDARKHWYGSVENRLDNLELNIVNWVRKNPAP